MQIDGTLNKLVAVKYMFAFLLVCEKHRYMASNTSSAMAFDEN